MATTDVDGDCVNVHAVVLDIEGTTTPISFVHDKLFGYIRLQLDPWLEAHWKEEGVQQCVRDLRQWAVDQHDKDADTNTAPSVAEEGAAAAEVRASVSTLVTWLMDRDLKVTPLKALQALIMKHGFHSGVLKGDVYEDAHAAVVHWAQRCGCPVYIYSSGSIGAQKLLFGFSSFGDMLPHIRGHFDTTTGPKVESQSYVTIAEEIGLDPSHLLFATDAVKEADAAVEAGWASVFLVHRPGNAPIPKDTPHPVITTFADLQAGVPVHGKRYSFGRHQ